MGARKDTAYPNGIYIIKFFVRQRCKFFLCRVPGLNLELKPGLCVFYSLLRVQSSLEKFPDIDNRTIFIGDSNRSSAVFICAVIHGIGCSFPENLFCLSCLDSVCIGKLEFCGLIRTQPETAFSICGIQTIIFQLSVLIEPIFLSGQFFLCPVLHLVELEFKESIFSRILYLLRYIICQFFGNGQNFHGLDGHSNRTAAQKFCRSFDPVERFILGRLIFLGSFRNLHADLKACILHGFQFKVAAFGGLAHIHCNCADGF